jgi:sn-glycerol 3-phosphate transport system ATP-binding protein
MGMSARLKVDVCEMLGADNLVHGLWNMQNLVVRLPQQHRPELGELIDVILPANRMHFFHAESGQRVE